MTLTKSGSVFDRDGNEVKPGTTLTVTRVGKTHKLSGSKTTTDLDARTPTGGTVFVQSGEVRVNQNYSREIPMTKTEAIQTLATNCECWKGREKVLEAMDDKLVEALVKQNEDAEELNLVVNELREEFGAEEDEVALNAMPAFIKKKIKANQTDPDDDDDDKGGTDDEAGDDDDEMMKKSPKKNQEQTVTLNKQTLLAELGKLSQEEVLNAIGLSDFVEQKAFMDRQLEQVKQAVINQLTERISDPKERKARQDEYKGLRLNQLEQISKAVADNHGQTKANQQTAAPPVYLGTGPTSFSPSKDDDYRPKPMEFPTINWAEEKKLLDAQQKLRAG